MDWTAITGIVVAGVVGPGVTGYLAIRRQEKQQEHERASDDLEDLRALLADAAKDLQRAEGLLGGILGLLLRHGEKIVTDQSSVSHIEDFKATGREVVLNDARIAVRLDDANPVADAHGDAVAALERAARAIGLVGGVGGASLSETNAELTAARDALADARTRFACAARAEVGTAVTRC
ncbi:MAG TPA: hypothetical protein VFI03_12190 [Solirubrobacterales bacterium]|nr:hypothetical protein [Solirubrobacterales bacterium]